MDGPVFDAGDEAALIQFVQGIEVDGIALELLGPHYFSDLLARPELHRLDRTDIVEHVKGAGDIGVLQSFELRVAG